MRIAELYASRQGEGFLTGTPSVFVRASGCNLRCWFCDTPFASWSPEGRDYSVDELLAETERFAESHVVLTGGEPMLFAEAEPLTRGWRAQGRHVTIETAGTVDRAVACDLMSISPKLASSAPDPGEWPQWRRRHQERRHAPRVIERLVAEYPYQIKFVVDTPEDLRDVEAWLAEFPQVDRSRVLLMPQGTEAAALESRREWLAPYCQRSGLRYCPRKQIEWYGFVRGT